MEDYKQDSLEKLSARLLEFARERDWEQFHAPKNLALSLMIEAAELAEHFQWKTTEESELLSAGQKHEAALEMADVFIYLLRLAQRMDIDLLQATLEKIEYNEQRYPADKVRGDSRKYNQY
jgi:NTP pyrophosphatase (non-canonical NTP hydrolase)